MMFNMFYYSFFFFTSTLFLGLVIQAEDDLSITMLHKNLHMTEQDLILRGKNELKGFVVSQIWLGGYCEGDPLDPFGTSSYQVPMIYKDKKINPLHICYLECIKPYINSTTMVLEIGPGQGSWTKSILSLNPKNIICLDALSAKHNYFWFHVGHQTSITYFQITDFLLRELPDNSIDYVFSFGTFCHISPLMCYEYFKNLFPKMRKNAQAFIMYADFDKKNRFARTYKLSKHLAQKIDEIAFFTYQNKTGNFTPIWYHLGIKRAQEMLEQIGYKVICSDMDINERDPIMHFVKP